MGEWKWVQWHIMGSESGYSGTSWVSESGYSGVPRVDETGDTVEGVLA